MLAILKGLEDAEAANTGLWAAHKGAPIAYEEAQALRDAAHAALLSGLRQLVSCLASKTVAATFVKVFVGEPPVAPVPKKAGLLRSVASAAKVWISGKSSFDGQSLALQAEMARFSRFRGLSADLQDHLQQQMAKATADFRGKWTDAVLAELVGRVIRFAFDRRDMTKGTVRYSQSPSVSDAMNEVMDSWFQVTVRPVALFLDTFKIKAEAKREACQEQRVGLLSEMLRVVEVLEKLKSLEAEVTAKLAATSGAAAAAAPAP
jgi:hypothetical protein